MIPITQLQEETVKPAKRRTTRFHVVQSLLAGVYILLVFWVMHSFQSELAVASLGASAFIAFGSPLAAASRPKFLIGGYCLGTLSGLIGYGLITLLRYRLVFPVYIPACALSVFISMLLMTVLDFEHPPSAALAVAVAIDANPILMSFAGLGCIIFLCILKEILKKYLRNL